jgi:nicotinamidase-related amidase
MTTLTITTKSQSLDSIALVLIDIQYFYFPGGAMELSEPETAAEKAKQLLDFFREKSALVVHVKHEYSPGGEIFKLVAPLESEKVFSKKELNSFLGTGLDEYLKQNHIKKLVLCGMQAHMCLEGATRAGHDLGYECIVIKDACATRDLKFDDVVIPAKQVHYSTLATLRNYAKILGTEEYLKRN